MLQTLHSGDSERNWLQMDENKKGTFSSSKPPSNNTLFLMQTTTNVGSSILFSQEIHAKVVINHICENRYWKKIFEVYMFAALGKM